MDGLEYIVGLKEQISGPAGKAAESLKKMVGGLGDTAGAIKKLSESGGSGSKSMGALAEAIGAAGAASLAAAAAIGILVAAGVGLVAYGASLSVEAAEFKGDTLDALELLTGTADEAQRTFDYLDRLSDALPLPRKKVFELGQELSLAGIDQQARLEKSIENIANLGQLPGGAGDRLKSLITKSVAGGGFKVNAKALTGTGATIDALADVLSKKLHKSTAAIKAELKAGTIAANDGIDALNEVVDAKIGGIARKQLKDVGVQVQKLKDWFGRLFEDVDIEPFTNALADMLAMFREGTAVGDAFKTIIQTGFTRLFEIAALVIPYIGKGIKQLIIWFLQAAIFLQPIIRGFILWWQQGTRLASLMWVLEGIGTLLKVIVTVAAVVAAAVLALNIAATAALGALLGAVGNFVSYALGKFGEFLDWFRDLHEKGFAIAGEFIEGLVNGFKEGAERVKDAVSGVGNAALDKIRGVFDSHSPSRILYSMGKDDLAGALAQGFEDGGAPDKIGSAAMPALGAIGGAVGGASAQVNNASASTTNVGGVNLHVNNVQDAEQLVQVLPNILANTFEQIAIQFGGNLSPQAA